MAIAHLGIVGVTPMGLGKLVHRSWFMTAESFASSQTGPGDQLFMVGRFTGLDERERREATVRAGTLSMASTVTVENKDWGNVKQESFFAEVNSKAGYSGSPVYVDIPIEIPPVLDVPMYPPRRQFMGLLGMTWGVWRGYVSLLDPDTHERLADGWVIHENSGIEMVIPAWRIMDLLMEVDVVKHRDLFAAESQKAVKGLKADAVATNAQPLPDEPPKVSRRTGLE